VREKEAGRSREERGIERRSREKDGLAGIRTD